MTLVWPNGTKTEPSFTSAYGPRDPIHTSAGWTRPYHVGCDWVGIGSLKAIGDGMVVQSSWLDWAGWQVLISLGKIGGVDTWARYCHLAERSPLNVGDRVKRGQVIGTEGATGQVTGKHLHMEIYRGAINRGSGKDPGNTVDPRAFIRAHLNNTPSPALPEEEDEDMARNSGIYWDAASVGKNTVMYAVFNTESGFWHEFSNGKGAGPMPGSYNNGLAGAMFTPSWAKVTESHANVIRQSCVAVRQGK